MGAYTIMGWCGYRLACGVVGSIYDQKRGEKMARLIDADKLMQMIPTEEYNARMAITHAPTVDAEPVVRCKDCKWCDITDYGAGEVLECILDRLYRINSISLEGETYFREVEPDDFCAWGERKEDETC